jgi:hypothetical protein
VKIEKNCYNITPWGKEGAVDCQVFKFNDSCESFLQYENDLFYIGIGSGEFGIIDIELFDMNQDNHLDLVYTFSFG